MDWKQTLQRTVDGAQKVAKTAVDSSREAWQLQELQGRLRTQKLALADWALTEYDDGAIPDEAVRALCAGIREDEARAEALRRSLRDTGKQVTDTLRRGCASVKNGGSHRLCCPGCGAPLSEQFAFCPHCGCVLETVDDLVSTAAEVSPPADAGKKDDVGPDAVTSDDVTETTGEENDL